MEQRCLKIYRIESDIEKFLSESINLYSSKAKQQQLHKSDETIESPPTKKARKVVWNSPLGIYY